MVSIRHYKLSSLPSTPIKNAVLYIFDQSTGKVRTYITDTNGVAIPLIDLTSLESVNLISPDGSIAISGTGTFSVQLSSALKSLINSALQSETDPTVPSHVKAILVSDITDWDTAYDEKINSVSFNTSDGVMTLTQQGGGTVTVNLDGRYSTVPDKNYVHAQPSAASVWNVAHNLGKFPSVVIVDSSKRQVDGEVQFTDNNNLTITFSSSFAGEAYIN